LACWPFRPIFLGLLRGLSMKIGSNPRDGPIKWPASTNRFHYRKLELPWRPRISLGAKIKPPRKVQFPWPRYSTLKETYIPWRFK
jgi:hypothetical protein